MQLGVLRDNPNAGGACYFIQLRFSGLLQRSLNNCLLLGMG